MSSQISGKLIELQAHENGVEIHALEFGDDYQRETVLVKPMFSKHLIDRGYSYCNGLVLLHLLPGKFSLWNPSTREYRVLPELPPECPRNPYLSFGLGYDSNTDDYKVVVLASGEGWDSQVFMFELRSSCWKTIRDGDNKYFPFFAYSGGNGDGFVDGALHFACARELEEQCMVVSFDVAKETFSQVENPDCQAFLDSNIHLNVIGGSLAMSFFYGEEGNEIDWVNTYIRKMEGNEFTWTRLYNVTKMSEHFSQEVFRCFSKGKHAYSTEGDGFFCCQGEVVFI